MLRPPYPRGKNRQQSLNRRLVSPRGVLDASEDRNISCLYRESNYQPVTISTVLSWLHWQHSLLQGADVHTSKFRKIRVFVLCYFTITMKQQKNSERYFFCSTIKITPIYIQRQTIKKNPPPPANFVHNSIRAVCRWNLYPELSKDLTIYKGAWIMSRSPTAHLVNFWFWKIF